MCRVSQSPFQVSIFLSQSARLLLGTRLLPIDLLYVSMFIARRVQELDQVAMEKRINLRTFDDDSLRARGKGSVSDAKGQKFDRDRYELARVGKEQVLKVCSTSKDVSSSLIILAPLRTGIHDWSFLWADVHLGNSARVSVRV